MATTKKTTIRKQITPKERKVIKKVLSGRMDPNKGIAKDILSRPHVAVTFEALLDQAGLTDTKLARRTKDIIKRKPAESVKVRTGAINTNQTSVDANALNAIRMIWQAKGKFTDKHDVTHHGEIGSMSDDHLDNLIKQGTQFLTNKKNRLENYDEPSSDN